MKNKNCLRASFNDALNSKVATATLRILIEKDMPLPISRIAKEIGSNYVTVRKHITYLQKTNLVKSIDYGMRRLYKANMADGRIIAFKNFIQIWNNSEHKQT